MVRGKSSDAGEEHLTSNDSRAAAPTPSLANDVVNGGLWTILAAVINLPVGAVTSVLVARGLGVKGFGDLSLLVATFAIATQVINAGISSGASQWLSAAYANGDTAGMRLLIQKTSGWHFLTQGPLLSLVALSLVGFDARYVIAIIAVQMTTAILGTAAVVMTATSQNSVLARISLAGTLAVSAATVTAALLSGSADLVWLVQQVGAALVTVAIFFAARAEWRQRVLRPRLTIRWPRGFTSFSLYASASGLASILVFGKSELFALKTYGYTRDIGLFALAASIAGLITTPMDSILGPLIPAAARIYASNPDRAAGVVLDLLRLSAILGALSLLTAPWLIAGLVPAVYGGHFGGARGFLLVLGAVSCIQSVLLPLNAFALASRAAQGVFIISVFCAVLDALIAFSAIPIAGVWAAVAASAAAQLAHIGLTARLVRHRLSISTGSIVTACRPLLVAAGLAPVAALPLLVGPSHITAWILCVIVGGAAMVTSLRVSPGLQLSSDFSQRIEAELSPRLATPYRALRLVIG